jgi:6-phosphofructokinase 1
MPVRRAVHEPARPRPGRRRPGAGHQQRIGAATIRAAVESVEVVGIEDGFEWIMHGNIDHVRPLTIDRVSRIHFRGSSHRHLASEPTSDPSCSRTQ